MVKIKQSIYFLLFFVLPYISIGQDVPEDEIEFNNIDPNYSSSMRFEVGLPIPIANNSLRNYYSGFYHIKLGYVKNIRKKYLLGGYVSNYILQNSLKDSVLSTLQRELTRNKNYTTELCLGYELFTSKRAVFSILLNGGYQWLDFSRKNVKTDQLIAGFQQNTYVLGITTTWTYFVEEKFTCGLFLSYYYSGYMYNPEKLNLSQKYTSVNTQLLTVGLSCNFGMGSK